MYFVSLDMVFPKLYGFFSDDVENEGSSNLHFCGSREHPSRCSAVSSAVPHYANWIHYGVHTLQVCFGFRQFQYKIS